MREDVHATVHTLSGSTAAFVEKGEPGGKFLFKYMKMYKTGLLLLTSTQTSTIMSNRKYANKYT